MALSGCLMTNDQTTIRLTREAAAVATTRAEPGEIWDGRWQITGPFGPGDHIAATGEAGLRHCPDWRDSGLKRTSLLAAPAVWRGNELRASPLANHSAGFAARLTRTAEVFHATFHTH